MNININKLKYQFFIEGYLSSAGALERPKLFHMELEKEVYQQAHQAALRWVDGGGAHE